MRRRVWMDITIGGGLEGIQEEEDEDEKKRIIRRSIKDNLGGKGAGVYVRT
jgi:hypothetical protein